MADLNRILTAMALLQLYRALVWLGDRCYATPAESLLAHMERRTVREAPLWLARVQIALFARIGQLWPERYGESP